MIGPDNRRRLDAWDRYARILEDQLDALRGGEPDLERFHQLAEQRTRLAQEIDGMGRPLPETPETDRLMARLRDRLEECRTLDQAVLDRLGRLRGDTDRALRQMQDRRAGRVGYMAHAGAGEDRPHVDVTS